MNNILVIRPGALGDALLAFPVLKALKEHYGCTRITLVSNAQVLPLAQAFGVAEETYDFQDIQWSELFSSSDIHTSSTRDLLSRTDLAICWMRDPDSIVEHNLKISGVKRLIIAPGRPSTGENLHIVDYLARTIGLPDTATQFVALTWCRPVESPSTSVGTRVDEGRLGGPLWLAVGGGDSQLASIKAHGITANHFIAIHPGSGATEKCWPISRFAEVIKGTWEQHRPVLLLTGPVDTKRVDDLLQLLPLPPTPEMFKMLSHAPLMEVAQHLQQCRYYLGNDSGITHLAAMLGVSTVAIFGPTDPKIWRPVGPFVRVIQGHTLEDITIDDVIGCLDLCRMLPRD